MIFSGAPFSDLTFSDLAPDAPIIPPESLSAPSYPRWVATPFVLPSLLVTLLAPTTGLLPSNAAHSFPLQVQQKLYLNADTSHGMPKVLYGDQIPPVKDAPFFGPQQHGRNEWPTPDTSKGMAKVLYGDQVPPFKPAPFFGPQQHGVNEWLPDDTSLSVPLSLRAGFVQPPLNVAPHFPPPRMLWKGLDTSQGTPELYKQEAIPPGSQWTRTATSLQPTVQDTSKGTSVALSSAVVVSLPPGQQVQIGPSRQFNVADTSRGMPATLFPAVVATLPPGAASFVALPDHQMRMVVNTSYGTTAPLFPFVQQANPPGQVAWVGLQRFWWQPADTSSGIPEGYRRESIPPGEQWTSTAPEPNRTVWDTGKAAYPVQYPFVVPPYNGIFTLARIQEREYNRPRIPFPVFAGYITPPVVNPVFLTRFNPLAAYRRDYPIQQPTRPKRSTSGVTPPPIVLVPDEEFYEFVPKRNWTETIKGRPWTEYIPKRRWSTKFQEIPTVSIGPKDPVEVVVVSIDFSQELGSETIVTSACAATTISGTDASPSAILSGSSSFTGGIVMQGVVGGVIGCTYEIKATITTSGGRTLVGATVLPIVVE